MCSPNLLIDQLVHSPSTKASPCLDSLEQFRMYTRHLDAYCRLRWYSATVTALGVIPNSLAISVFPKPDALRVTIFCG